MECRVCGNGKVNVNVGNVSGIWKNDHAVSYCPECGLYFLNEMPTEEEMKEYYIHEYHSSTGFSVKMKTLFSDFRAKSQLLYLKRFLVLRGLSAIEIGAAKGLLLKGLKKNGAEVFGTEYGEDIRKEVLKKYGFEMSDDDFLNLKGEYDLLIMSHVYEHFRDHRQTLAQCRNILKPNGKIFFEVPNSPLPNELSESELDFYLKTPHTYNFTLESLRLSLENEGFEIINIERCMLRVPFFITRKARHRINYSLLIGSLPPVYLWPHLAMLLGFSCVFRGHSHQTVSADSPWFWNEKLRVIAKKKI